MLPVGRDISGSPILSSLERNGGVRQVTRRVYVRFVLLLLGFVRGVVSQSGVLMRESCVPNEATVLRGLQ
jgi:hypothetical protein